MQQAQNGALFNVQAYFLYACNHRTKIITTKAIVLSNNYANIAYTKHSNTMKNTQKHPQRAVNAEKLILFILFNVALLTMIAFCASFQASAEVFFLSIVLIAFDFLFIALAVESNKRQ
jgi:hypothetical protein